MSPSYSRFILFIIKITGRHFRVLKYMNRIITCSENTVRFTSRYFINHWTNDLTKAKIRKHYYTGVMNTRCEGHNEFNQFFYSWRITPDLEYFSAGIYGRKFNDFLGDISFSEEDHITHLSVIIGGIQAWPCLKVVHLRSLSAFYRVDPPLPDSDSL